MNNIWFTWGDVFNASLQELWWGFIQFAPKLVLAIVFFIIGWVLGNLIARAFEQVINTLKIDKLLQSVGTDEILKKAGLSLNSGYFLGQVVKWFIIIVFLLPSLSLVGLDYVAMFLRDGVLAFLPRIIVAAFILIIAAFISDFVSKVVSSGSKALNVRSANMLGVIIKYTIWVFAFIIALGQLGIAETYMNILFTGIIAMLALGGAIAIGMGAKDTVSSFLSKMKEDMSNK
jgi:small-conductance mechanosensitive channel